MRFRPLAAAIAALLGACGGGHSPSSTTNRAPVATQQSVSTNQDTALGVMLAGTDPDGDSLQYSIVATPAHGTLTGTPPNITYTPAAGYSGSDSFSFRVNDGTASSPVATVSITVLPPAGTPTANGQNVSVDEDQTLDITLTGTDPDGDPLTYSIFGSPGHGSLTGTPPLVTYAPDTDYNGSDNFGFVVSDGANTSAPAVVNIQIQPVNDPPVLTSPTYIPLRRDLPLSILLTGADIEGDGVAFSVSGQPTHGTLAGLIPNLVYTPDAGFVGEDTLLINIADNASIPASAQVTITLSVQFTGSMQALNDTGVTLCGNETQNDLNCSSVIPPYDQQDATLGRDVTENNDNDGRRGFVFIKLRADGQPLTIQNISWDDFGSESAGSKWSCVSDEVTGLVWEVKTNDQTLHDRFLNSFTWYNSTGVNDRGSPGDQNTSSMECIDYDDINYPYCNTEAFVDRVNQDGLCGSNDWRLPTRGELQSLVDYGQTGPRPDARYFPYGGGGRYWTSTPYTVFYDAAWIVDFGNGWVTTEFSNFPYSVRLVRGD